MFHTRKSQRLNSGLRMVVAVKLGDPNLLAELVPLSRVAGVARIDVVRDHPGPEVGKVTYYSPPRVLRRHPVLCAGWKLATLVWLGLVDQPDIMHGIRLWPHGLLVWIAANVTGRRLGFSLLDGQHEILLDPKGRPLPRMRATRIRRWLLIQMLKKSSFTTCTGSLTRRALVARGIREERIHITYHPVACISGRVFCPSRPPWQYDVLYVGRLSREKHVEVVLEVVAALRCTHPDVSACIVGDGPEMQRLLMHAERLSLGASVQFVGFQPDTTPYYTQSRVLLLPSEREGFPLVFIEALHCGLPAVVTRCGDIVDLARHGENCMLVDDWSMTNDFVEAARRLMDDCEMWLQVSANAMRASTTLTLDNVVCQWEHGVQSFTASHQTPHE